jgi:6-pyruvoyl-tetrahydropterin synthase
MIIDFSIIKNYINDTYDHRILNKCPFGEDVLANIESSFGVNLLDTPFKWGDIENPTAENISTKISKDITNLLANVKQHIQSITVEVFESPKNSVISTMNAEEL